MKTIGKPVAEEILWEQVDAISDSEDTMPYLSLISLYELSNPRSHKDPTQPLIRSVLNLVLSAGLNPLEILDNLQEEIARKRTP